jgi:hypothetical protein
VAALKGRPVMQWGLLKSPLVRLLLWARAEEAGTTFPHSSRTPRGAVKWQLSREAGTSPLGQDWEIGSGPGGATERYHCKWDTAQGSTA